VAAEYEVNIKLNSKDIETQLDGIGKKISKLGKSKGGSARKKSGIAGLLPSTQELKAQERGIVQLIDRFAQRKERAIARSNALNKVELRLNKQLISQARKRVRLQGANAMQGKGRMAAEGINTRTNVQERKLKLVNKVNELEAKGLNVQKFRTQIGKISEQQSAKRFASAEKEIRLLRKMLEIDQSRARILRSERQNFPSSPVRGTRAMMGSPAQIAASGRQITSPIRGGLGFPGSPAFLAGKTVSSTPFGPKFPTGGPASPVKGNKNLIGSPAYFKDLSQQISKLARQGGAKNPIRGNKNLVGSPAYYDHQRQELEKAIKRGGERSPIGGRKDLIGSPAQITASARAGGPRSPIRGGANIAGSPLARLGGMKRLEQIGLGAGFPLLFGGGAGSILGGAIGGAMGSFGAQIAFSAIGQQVDAFIASVVNVGTALTSASGTIEMFREKNLFSSDAVKEHALQLEEQGKMQELATVLAKDLASQIGKNAVESFQVLGDETKEFLGIINHLFLAVQGFVAGPLAKFLSAINTVLGGVSADIQFGSLQGSLTGEARAEFDKIVAEKQGTRNLTARERQRAIRKGESTDPVLGRLTSKVKQEVLKDSRIEKLRQTIAITGRTNFEDRLGFKPPKNAAAEKARREEERLQKRLAKLDQERLKVIEISKFKEKIALAEAAGDALGVVRIQNEQRLEEIEQDKLKSLISATTEKEKQAIADLAAAKTEATKLENARLLAAEEASIARSREDSLRPLEEQRALLEAKLNGNEQEVRIKQQIANILRSNTNLNKQEVEDLVNKNNLLEEQVAQVVRLEGLYQSIGSAIESGLVNGIMGAIDGTKTLQESLAGILKDVGSIVLQFGIRTGLNAINPTMFPMAEGGYVTSPTNAIIGEGGEPEYVIPESKMRTAMSRYSRGSRGESVIPEFAAAETVGASGGGTAVAAPIDVRYTVERINSIDYVTADQFQNGMQQAAQQGAKQGEQQTLKRLQMSGSTRKRIGI